jgi:hypothetical protein
MSKPRIHGFAVSIDAIEGPNQDIENPFGVDNDFVVCGADNIGLQ